MDTQTRRGFLQTPMILAAVGTAIPTVPAAGTTPRGEFAMRMRRIQDRLTRPGFPEYTQEFILADVKLDPSYPRLYSDFSGDVSGRYIEALAVAPAGDPAKLDELVRELLRYQRPDGRFGNAALSFESTAIGKPQMALLWGNGRLLVGLLAYHRARPAPAVLNAARQLGEFLLRVRQQCARPEVAQRLQGLGAYGLICFTQLIEGLVMLSQASGDSRYIEAARAIAPLLPPRGIQHTHGYLSTLRGILLLHEATGDPGLLDSVEDAYRELVLSPDYVVFGGVLEFFGAETPGLSPADLKKLGEIDNKDPQDEGCSLADFVRLSLQLWRATGRAEYLDRAERCLLNHFFANQFASGDFGHHILYKRGFRPSESPGKAWWCCNMHGLRAFPDVLEAMVTGEAGAVRVNLFLDGAYSNANIALAMQTTPALDGVTITIERDSSGVVPLAVRKPGWAAGVAMRVDGQPAQPITDGGCLVLSRPWKKGQRVEVDFDCLEYLQLRSGQILSLTELGREPVEAALFRGPWLLGVHEAEEPAFFERPWMWGAPNENTLSLPPRLQGALRQDGALRVPYVHGGWPGSAAVTLRPIAAQMSFHQQQVLAVWMTFRAGGQT